MRVGGLRLVGGVGIDHGLRHEADEVHGVAAGGVVALAVLEEVGGVGEDGVEAVELVGVFVVGERLAVALDDAGDAAFFAFDDLAGDVGFGVDLADAVAEGELALVVDDGELVGGGGLYPADGRAGREGFLRLCGKRGGEEKCRTGEECWREEARVGIGYGMKQLAGWAGQKHLLRTL